MKFNGPGISAFKTILLAGVIGFFLLPSNATRAFDFTPLALGTLPDGSVVEGYNFELDPGEVFPWHFHPINLYCVVIQGEMTLHYGCGTKSQVVSVGSAFHEFPGQVHQPENTGTSKAWAFCSGGGLPACYGDYTDAVLVNGPFCEHGLSRRLHVPTCAEVNLCKVNRDLGVYYDCPASLLLRKDENENQCGEQGHSHE